MRHVSALVALAALLLIAGRYHNPDELLVTSETTQPWSHLFEGQKLRVSYRLLLGSPRLAKGSYQVQVSAPAAAELRTRPWMGAQLDDSDSDTPVWNIDVPELAPYPVYMTEEPLQPVSGVMVDLSARYQGPVEVDVSGRRFVFDPTEIELGRPKDFADGFLRVERVPDTATVARTTRDEDYPALCAAKDGSLWLAWIEFDGRADVLRVARWKEDTRTDFDPIAGPGDLYRAAIAEHDGRIWVVWPEQRSGNWDLHARSHSAEGWSTTVRLTESRYPDWQPRLRSGAGRLWLAWQGSRKTREGVDSEIWLRFFENGAWAEPVNVSNHPSNDWEPALVTGDGKAFVAWDSYRNGNYDIFLAESDGKEDTIRPIVAGPNLQIRADLVRDAQGRIWCSWEEADPDWGKDSVAFDRGLHRERRVGVRCLEGDQMRSGPQLWTKPLPHIGEQTEMARLAFDSSGRLWLFFRINFLNQIWQQAAMFLEGARWSEPVVFDASFGRQAAPLSVVADANGDLAVSWVSDTRSLPAPLNLNDVFQALHNDIHLTRIAAGTGDDPAMAGSVVEAGSAPSSDIGPPRWKRSWSDHVMKAKGRSYRLLWGELHRHTDINHHGRPDGSLEDAYRYAMDAAQMDFFATTDHMPGEPRLSGVNGMTWWRTQKYADLHRLDQSFVPLYGYERSRRFPSGHKNVVFATRGGPLLKGTNDNNVPNDLWAMLDRAPFSGVVIPHQLTGPALSWNYHNPRYEPVMEIYQGRRQSYEYDGAPQPPGVSQIWGKREGSWAWDALSRGIRLGFIASSDHSSTHMSYAAVYAEEFSRQSIVDAMKSRRTYAASDNIVLDFRLELPDGELLMGEVGVAASLPRIRVRAIGTAPIRTIEVIRDNQFVYSSHPEEQETEFTYTPTGRLERTTYYYVRLIQSDGHMAWSSPVWLEPK